MEKSTYRFQITKIIKVKIRKKEKGEKNRLNLNGKICVGDYIEFPVSRNVL